MREWMVHCWGGAWNPGANPSIEKDLGITMGYHYFTDEKEKNCFIQFLNIYRYKQQGIVFTVDYGEMSHKRTVFVGTFRYQDKDYILDYDFGYEFSEEDAVYIFTLGNFGCDCNRSTFLRCKYGDAVPDLGCGSEIELVDYHFEYLD